MESIPSFYMPPSLTSITSDLIIRLFIYEDYDDCNYYRWDPVRIWEFETHQPKKKKNKKVNDFPQPVDNSVYGHPPPPWKELRKFRNWWCEESLKILGHLVDSPLRKHIISALEKQSWTSQSSEEDILFLLLKLFMDSQIDFSSKTILPIQSSWFQDLALIIDKLGPYQLQKLIVNEDVFQGNPIILSAIIQNSPQLQVLRIAQWELHNDILFSLGGHCSHLVEFVINGMEPDLFMSDEAFFKCFFNGMSCSEVYECHKNGVQPQLSFTQIKYVDLLFCKQTERLLKMISYFYPNANLSAIDAYQDYCNLADPFLSIGCKMPFLRVSTNIKGLLDGRLEQIVKHSSFLKELRLNIDDNFPGTDIESIYKSHIELASSNLKELFRQVKTLDSLVLRPHEGVDMVQVSLPVFSAHGFILKSLHFIYDYSSVNTNTLYQLLNLCPSLERLVLDIGFHVGNSASKTFTTELVEHPTLETVIFQNILYDLERNPDDCGEDELVFSKIAKELLNKSPNLRSFSMHLEEYLEVYFYLGSKSVERLHLTLSKEYSSHWLMKILPNFPNLKMLSLDGCHQSLWEERLRTISKSSIVVTKKRPEFANVLSWKKKSFSSGQPLVIMVM